VRISKRTASVNVVADFHLVGGSRRIAVALGVVGACAVSLSLWAQTASTLEPVEYPEGYRHFVHVKSTLIGRESPDFQRNGGFHHFYANDKAIEGYRTGTFPDGSVLVDDSLEALESGGKTTEGTRHRVAVMVKDHERYGSTRGWGFEVFKGDSRDGALTAEGRAACVVCHTSGRDSVFSEYRP
jgi:hypothetical protein